MAEKQEKMKQIFISGAVVFGLLLTACTAEVTTTENGGDTDNVENNEGEETTSGNMTCGEVLNDVDNLLGSEVTITATCWGTSKTMTGEVNLNLGDGKLEGMRSAPVVVKFAEDKADVAEAIQRDQEVTIKAKVNDYKYGAVELIDPTIVK